MHGDYWTFRAWHRAANHLQTCQRKKERLALVCLLTGCTHECRMRHITSYMRRNLPMMQILILGILPRGAWSLPNPYQWPNRLTEGIILVNNASQVLSALCTMVAAWLAHPA